MFELCFSTLCRVGFGGAPGDNQANDINVVSVPSVGSGLVERAIIPTLLLLNLCFSTLCRVGFGGAM